MCTTLKKYSFLKEFLILAIDDSKKIEVTLFFYKLCVVALVVHSDGFYVLFFGAILADIVAVGANTKNVLKVN